MKSLDCNQIKNFINLEIIGEEEIRTKKKNLYIFFLNLKKFLQFDAAMAFKPNFYYIVYDLHTFQSINLNYNSNKN